MHWLLLILHGIGIVGAVIAGRRSMQAALGVAAIPPLVTALWAVNELISGDSANPLISELTWVGEFDITFRFLAGPVALMLTLLVSGIGALVFTYGIGYFGSGAASAQSFPAILLAFSASMLGLVWADSVWTLFIFWEFTSITSFLLVGYKSTYDDVLASARRALLITASGGLVLLAGMLILTQETGTTVLSEMGPVTGTAATVAAVLIMIGAATKSAQVPFHVWLPGAMAAPTPVSAYLHSATMVKAGVVLVALTGRFFAVESGLGAWGWLGVAFGTASVFWGAIGALRHTDAKLMLAWGTVSQLGLMITLLSVGTGKAVFAATSIVFAHAIFKAALFMVVGEIDVRTGTRQISELGGLSRTMPIAFGVSVISALSMAGVPPMLGFAAKEAAVEAVLKLKGLEQVVVGITVIGGSVLTVAYSVRFLIAVFGRGPATEVAPRRPFMTAPAAILAALSVVLFFTAPMVNDIVVPAATVFNEKSSVYELIRWPGLKTAFLISVGIVAAGSVFGWWVAQTIRPAPASIGADATDNAVETVLRASKEVSARVQHGSLPVYLAVMVSVAFVATLPLVLSLQTEHLVLWASPLQGAIVVALLASAIAGSYVRTRLGAALSLGGVGIAMSGLFLIQGAPDLALTQLLVETIVVVGFVLGLGHLGRRFPSIPNAFKTLRIVLSVLVGTGVALGVASAAQQPSGAPPLEALTAESVDVGGGNNVVNVILTDLRALDTMGEVVVLATVAVGVAALARSRRDDEVPA